MNHRLVTPSIVLVSFAATFGFSSWHAGLWQSTPAAEVPMIATALAAAPVATPDVPPPAALDSPAPVLRATVIAPPTAEPPLPDAEGDAQDESSNPPPAPPLPADPSDFLAAQDRAANHSSRSR